MNPLRRMLGLTVYVEVEHKSFNVSLLPLKMLNKFVYQKCEGNATCD